MADKKKSGLLLTEGALRKRYPGSNIASKICVPADKTLRLPCSVLAINKHLGGGIKYGSIIEVAGEESSGKTLLAMDFGKCAQTLGGVVLWDDAESTFDGVWAKKHGMDLNRVELLPYENEFEVVSDWIADMCIFYRSKLTNNQPIVLVVDSLAILETGDAMEIAEVDAKAEMGKRSFNMGKLLRKRMRIFAQYGIVVIFINQMRKKVGVSQFEEKDTTPLEQAMKFYASQRVWIFRGARIRNKKKQWVGNLVYFRTRKNKTAPPSDNIKLNVYFKQHEGKFGFDKYFGFDELLVESGVVRRSQARFYYKEKMIAKGDDAFRALLANDQDLRQRLIKKARINTVSRTRERLADIGRNLYPVKLKVKKTQDDEE